MKSNNISVRLDAVSKATINIIQSLTPEATRSAIINDALRLYNLVLLSDNPLKEQIKELHMYPYHIVIKELEKEHENQ